MWKVKSISISTIVPPVPAAKRISSPVIKSSRLSKYRRIDLVEDSEQSEEVALESVEDLSLRRSPRIKNRKKVAKMTKRSNDSSFFGQSDGDSFSLPVGTSFCNSPKDQFAKRSEQAKRSILSRTSVTESVLPSRKTTGNKYGDDGSSFQQMTDKRKCPVSIALFKAINRNTKKR